MSDALATFRLLEQDGKLDDEKEFAFLALLGRPSSAKQALRLDEPYFVWRENHYAGKRHYHSYHFLHSSKGEWALRVVTFFKVDDPVDLFDFEWAKLPPGAREFLLPLVLTAGTVDGKVIFRQQAPGISPQIQKVLTLFSKCSRYESFLKGLPNRNAMDVGDHHDCGAFRVKFMLLPVLPTELIRPDDWCEVKPTHVFQAVCKTCRKCFLSCNAQIFDAFGPCHWDVDWQVAMNTAFHLYELHRTHCKHSESARKVEIPRHPKERERSLEYRRANFALRKNKTDENRVLNYSARLVYGFVRLLNAESMQFDELLSLE